MRLRLESTFLDHLEKTVSYQTTITPAGNAVEIAMMFQKFEMMRAHKAIERPITDEKISAKIDECKVDFRKVLENRSSRLLTFFAERLKGQLREQGARHDLVDAVFALGGQDDLFLVVHRIEALGKFLDTDDGKNLLAGTKRANNILAIEEKKEQRKFDGVADRELYKVEEEATLAFEIARAKQSTLRAVEAEDFEGVMVHLARLRPAVDAFFDKVKVNDDDPKVRENRLKLLNEIRAATRAVADFSRIEG